MRTRRRGCLCLPDGGSDEVEDDRSVERRDSDLTEESSAVSDDKSRERGYTIREKEQCTTALGGVTHSLDTHGKNIALACRKWTRLVHVPGPRVEAIPLPVAQ